MEGTFDSAKNQYKSNYVQFFLTKEPKYKSAYETAQKTMDSILEKAPTPGQEPEKLKPIQERSYRAFHQEVSSQTSLPSQSWKYWTLGSLLLVTTVLGMF
jgi:CHASE3 domain sensor protein